IASENDLLGNTTAIRHNETCRELLSRYRNPVVFRQREGHSKRTTAWHDGHLVKRIVALHDHCAHSVARLVVSREAALVFLHHERLALGTKHHLVLGFL